MQHGSYLAGHMQLRIVPNKILVGISRYWINWPPFVRSGSSQKVLPFIVLCVDSIANVDTQRREIVRSLENGGRRTITGSLETS